MSISGIENITVPSFDPALRELDEAGVRWDVRHAVEQGFTATLLALNAGLSAGEMRRFVEIAVDEAAGRLQVGVDMPLDSFALAADILPFAADAGATHAVLGVPQSFAPRAEDEVFEAYAELASASSLRLVLPVGDVGFPPEMGGGVPWGAYARLAGLETVGAVTVTTWMPQVLFGALQMFGGRLEIGVGTPALLGALPLLADDYGIEWLSPAHWELWQSPEQPHLVRYLEHAVAGRKSEALEVHWRLAPARGIAFGAGLLDLELDGLPHWTMAKYLGWTVGGNGGVTREPAQHLKPHQVAARQAMLQAIGIAPRSDEAEFLRGRSAVPA